MAFARTPGAREDESPYLDPPHAPWSIWVADAATGYAHRAWQARRGMGETMYQSTSNAQLYWLAGDHIAFAWEGTGWQNLYAVPARGGNAKALATGAFEAETIVPALDGRSLLYATNEGDIDRRHIWQVGLERETTSPDIGCAGSVGTDAARAWRLRLCKRGIQRCYDAHDWLDKGNDRWRSDAGEFSRR